MVQTNDRSPRRLEGQQVQIGLVDRPVAWLLVKMVRLYQLTLSPFIGGQCRFYPTCSAYAITAIDRHGALRGVWLAAKRIGKCQPLHPGGVDEVPPAAR